MSLHACSTSAIFGTVTLAAFLFCFLPAVFFENLQKHRFPRQHAGCLAKNEMESKRCESGETVYQLDEAGVTRAVDDDPEGSSANHRAWVTFES